MLSFQEFISIYLHNLGKIRLIICQYKEKKINHEQYQIFGSFYC